MNINEEQAEGIKIIGKGFEYVYARKKPNADTTIIQEVWFKNFSNGERGEEEDDDEEEYEGEKGFKRINKN